MLVIISDKSINQLDINATGTMAEILDELSIAVGAVYHHIKEVDSEDAEFFRASLGPQFDYESQIWSHKCKSNALTIRTIGYEEE